MCFPVSTSMCVRVRVYIFYNNVISSMALSRCINIEYNVRIENYLLFTLENV